MIIRLRVVLNTTFFVDNDWRFEVVSRVKFGNKNRQHSFPGLRPTEQSDPMIVYYPYAHEKGIFYYMLLLIANLLP